MRTHVERAQWRYRDVRALRPVLLDAGHIVHTLCEVLRFAGWMPVIQYVRERPATDAGAAWLSEPVLAAVTDTPTSSGQGHDAPNRARMPVTKRLRTNPCAYLHLRNGCLAAEAVWPDPGETKLSLPELLAVTHCLTSRRDDRDVTRSGIIAAAPGVDDAGIDRLVGAGVLVDAEAVLELERSLARWVHHGWYLSALAMMAARSTDREPASRPAHPPLWPSRDALLGVMHRRRTSRRFAARQLPLEDLDRVLDALRGDVLQDVTVRVAALAVDGMRCGLYAWSPQGFTGTGLPVSRDDIRRLTIGQSWAGDGAAVVWLVRALDPSAPERYEPDIMDLGRLGQRLCLAATATGVDIFLTPAVSDAPLFDVLQVECPERAIAYACTLGRATT